MWLGTTTSCGPVLGRSPPARASLASIHSGCRHCVFIASGQRLMWRPGVAISNLVTRAQPWACAGRGARRWRRPGPPAVRGSPPGGHSCHRQRFQRFCWIWCVSSGGRVTSKPGGESLERLGKLTFPPSRGWIVVWVPSTHQILGGLGCGPHPPKRGERFGKLGKLTFPPKRCPFWNHRKLVFLSFGEVFRA